MNVKEIKKCSFQENLRTMKVLHLAIYSKFDIIIQRGMCKLLPHNEKIKITKFML